MEELFNQLSKEDVSDWVENPVTEVFLSYIEQLAKMENTGVHEALKEGEKDQAALCNASYVTYEEILDLPRILMEDVKERKIENKT